MATIGVYTRSLTCTSGLGQPSAPSFPTPNLPAPKPPISRSESLPCSLSYTRSPRPRVTAFTKRMSPMNTTLSTISTPVPATERQRLVGAAAPSFKEIHDEQPPSPPPPISNGTIINLIFTATILIPLAVGIHTCVRLNQVSHQIIELPAEQPVYNNDHNNDHEDDDDEAELRDLKKYGYRPDTRIELGTARAVRLSPPGSASIVNVRGGRGDGRRLSLGLTLASSVRDVGALPDLSGAQAVLACDGGGGGGEKAQGEEEEKEVGAVGPVVVVARPAETEPEPGPEKRRLGRALRKRISTPRFQGGGGGGVREFVRSFGFARERTFTGCDDGRSFD